MSKKSIIAVLMMIFSIGIISMYTTYAFNNEVIPLGDTESDYNLIYSISENSKMQVNLVPNETKFVDVVLTNTYTSTIRYGAFYYAVNPSKLPNNVKISLADTSDSPLQNIIEPKDRKIVSIKIENNSEYNVTLIVGALIGFENGNIIDLETDKQILIK